MLDQADKCSIPILVPSEEFLPFAMSLEVAIADELCSDRTAERRSTQQSESGDANLSDIYELLYFLEGSGCVQVEGKEGSVAVSAGDSVMAAAGQVRVTCPPECAAVRLQTPAPACEDRSAGTLAYLKLVIPFDFMMAAGDNARAAASQRAASSATRHWHLDSSKPVPAGYLSQILAATKRQTRELMRPPIGGPHQEPQDHSKAHASLDMRMPVAAAPRSTSEAQLQGNGVEHLQSQEFRTNVHDAVSRDDLHGLTIQADLAPDFAEQQQQYHRDRLISHTPAAHDTSIPVHRPHVRGACGPDEIELQVATDGEPPVTMCMQAHLPSETTTFPVGSPSSGLAPHVAEGKERFEGRWRPLQQSAEVLINASRSLLQIFTTATSAVVWSGARSRTWLEETPFIKRSLSDAPSFRLPNQDNLLALVFDPTSHVDAPPFTFGVEIFPAGHETTPHVHDTAHELFFIISGEGTAFCDGHRFSVGPGDTVVFPPGCEHGIDNASGCRMYCLELMLPNEKFAELVRAGTPINELDGSDMCVLASVGCR